MVLVDECQNKDKIHNCRNSKQKLHMLGISENTMLITAIQRLVKYNLMSKLTGTEVLNGPLSRYARENINYLKNTNIAVRINPTKEEASNIGKLLRVLKKECGISIPNPFKQVKGRTYDPRLNTVPMSSVNKVFEVMYNDAKYSDLNKCILLCISLGFRTSEAVKLKYEDICFEREIIIIRESKHAPNGRVLPFCAIMPEYKSMVLDILRLPEGASNKDNIMFQGVDEIEHASKTLRITRALYDIIEKAKIAPFKLKDLRHTFAVQAVKRNADINGISNHLGHKNLDTTFKFYVKSINEVVDWGC